MTLNCGPIIRPHELDALREITTTLDALQAATGDYHTDSVNGYRQSVQVTIRFDRPAGALRNIEAAGQITRCAAPLNMLAKRLLWLARQHPELVGGVLDPQMIAEGNQL